MNISSFVIEQALKRLKIPAQFIRQFQIAGKLSDVDGKGFPAELFQISAPLITRGLLNYALLQMRKDWLYPYWVNQQLDPKSISFVARSQNPLLLNITHRNWTMLGSPNGEHEAIVDPCGLTTPLPREWSIDVWLVSPQGVFFPSRSFPLLQEYDTHAPRIITQFNIHGIALDIEAFVDVTTHGRDVLFHSVHVTNLRDSLFDGTVYIAVRPFNPEGVAPIQHVELKNRRQLYVDSTLGLHLSEEPQRVYCSNAVQGDIADHLRTQAEKESVSSVQDPEVKLSSSCSFGLAHAAIGYSIQLAPGARRSICCSIALGKKHDIRNIKPQSTWRISFEERKERHQVRWAKERSAGAAITLADPHLQNLFDANVLALLQLHDDTFISPGPYVYHHFWFRDAAPMVYALERLGFHRRAQRVIDGFPPRITKDGFFSGPDGEWDSNGEALWLIEQHAAFSHSLSWTKQFFPSVQQGVEWIIRKRKKSIDSLSTHRGLLPPSLSAEHFGTVDQYYWDSFWGVRGVRSAAAFARLLHRDEANRWDHEADMFSRDIRRSLEIVSHRLGKHLIPASPSRPFDESAVGFVAGIYPLNITDIFSSAFETTLNEFTERFIDENGFYHPIVHSGYNPYLTLQLAHAFLMYNQPQKSWKIAETIFRKCVPPYSLPEALHPKTGGGAMGDGHHGWAAAEIVLFLQDCLVRENHGRIYLFRDIRNGMIQWGKDFELRRAATSLGRIDCTIRYETQKKGICTFTMEPSNPRFFGQMEITFPFPLKRVLAVSSNLDIRVEHRRQTTIVSFQSHNATLLLEM